MKKFLIKIIKLYQKTPTRVHSNCKYIPTCSQYAITVIDEYGVFIGGAKAIKRIFRCNPLSKGGIDLPPTKRRKNEKKI